MKVDGQQSVLFDYFGLGKFEEANVKKKTDFNVADLFNGGLKEHLEIDAGAGDDLIKVSKTGDNQYTVSVNGQEFQLTREEMENLELDAGAGNDKIIIDESVDVAIKVNGGGGDDQIVNHASGIEIDGGKGDDQITSTGDLNDIRGGAGRDTISVTGNGNHVTGGGGGFWDFFAFLGLSQDHVSVSGEGNKVD